MTNKKQRMKNRATALDLYYRLPPKRRCSHCGALDHHGHYYPPSLRDAGGWICESMEKVK